VTTFAQRIALEQLTESRDGAPHLESLDGQVVEMHAPRLWHDDGASIAMLAQQAGVSVTYVHVDLNHYSEEQRTVMP